MTNEPQFRAGRIAWMFRKSGAEGERTKLFEDLPVSRKTKLRKEARLHPLEAPALACVVSDDEWVLVTNERIVWSSSEEMRELSFSDLADATVEPHDLLAARSKSSLAILTLRTVSGQVHKLALEPGAPFSGFWNAIKMMARRGRGS